MEDKTESVILDILDGILEKSGDEQQLPEESFFLRKGRDGELYWIATFSNNMKDDDNPPEIIAESSHRRFVKMVDAGQFPMPELWYWHEKAWAFGDALWIGLDVHDDVVFPVAAGRIRKNPAAMKIAKAVDANAPDHLVSHGMPIPSIARDPVRKEIILAHQTIEISPLPKLRAANKGTSVQLLRKENQQMIDQEKRESAADVLDLLPEDFSELENANGDLASQGKEQGREVKEVSTTKAQVEEEEEETEDKPAGKEQNQPEQVAYVSKEEFDKTAEALVGALSTIVSQLKEIKQDVLASKQQFEQAQKEQEAKETPAAAWHDQIISAVDVESTKVDGRTKEAKAKPTLPEGMDQKSAPAHSTGVPFLDSLVVGAVNKGHYNFQVANPFGGGN